MITTTPKKVVSNKIVIPAPKMRVNFFRPGGFHSPAKRPYSRKVGKSTTEN
jgi:hypothetical protein